MTADAPTVQSSIAEVWYLKNITFGLGGNKRQYKIITQNFNGSVLCFKSQRPLLMSWPGLVL
jgi:hypothetical protein